MQFLSRNPARALGLEQKKGLLEPEYDADLLLMDENWNVIATIVGGNIVYKAHNDIFLQ